MPHFIDDAMNPSPSDRELLLYQSGELGWLARRRVARRLAADSEGARLLSDIDHWMKLGRSDADETALSDFTLNRIREVANVQPPAKRRPPEWRPAWVYATLSLALLALGSWMIWPAARTDVAAVEPRAGWEIEYAAQWLAFEAVTDRLQARLIPVNGSDDLEALAAELLYWEDAT
jgi:anti-sigma factor RsiW